tara:strand:- start:8154 stop:9167 length:1014 start_codon:yes stop_codon:yes gene_type:complete
MKNIKNYWVGKYGPMMIAEIGANHEGNFNQAKKLVRLAIKADVDVVKFQLYTGGGIVNKKISKKRFNHFQKFELKKSEHLYLAKMVKDHGLKYSASVWDIKMIDWIDKYMDFYKIGSGDLTAYPVLNEISKKNKPILLSTGLSNLKEIINTINFLKTRNKYYRKKNNIALLQCTAAYPCKDSELNLSTINYLKKKTGLRVGFSDHSEGDLAILSSYLLGSEIMEFHFTETRIGKKFRDHQVSLTTAEVLKLNNQLMRVNLMKGNKIKNITYTEKKKSHHKSFRRAIYPARDINKGEIIKSQDLICLRPNVGLDARFFDKILNKKSKKKLVKLQKINF